MIPNKELSYQERIVLLREKKMEYTKEKWEVIGSMDMDDLSFILPPPELRKIIETISSSGIPIKDVILNNVEMVSNHSSGGIFGPKANGENFRRLLEAHPVFIDPLSGLTGAYMVNYLSFRNPAWNPDFDYSHLKEGHDKYKTIHGIGAIQHFCQDESIGLKLGFGGLLEKIRHYKKINTGKDKQDFYDGLENIIIGIQNWIARHVIAGRKMASEETNPQFKKNLLDMSNINEHLIFLTPRTFREAVQWMNWYQLAAKMYYANGSLGRVDLFLYPFYKKDKEAGLLTDEEATFYLACHLLRDTSYSQVGGPDESGKDITNELSYLMLEAAHWLKIPSNVGVCVGKNVDPGLLKRGVKIMFEDKTGIPKFLGVENTTVGFAKNGYPVELARQRAYSGCHWSALPGKEYTMNDCVKINFAAIFDVALRDMISKETEPNTEKLWGYFENHLRKAIENLALSVDFHIEHMHNVFPELILDILCYGPIERGIDASHGGVEYINICVDGAALATTADSFAALEQRIDKEKRISWKEIMHHLDTDWTEPDGEKIRLMMKNIPHYGYGGTRGDEFARKISETFTKIVKEKPTPDGYNMIPGLFSWATTISMGKDVPATPNGRKAFAPISHGSNPDPGFRKDGAPTAMSIAIASVQSGYGNSCPMQMELDPGISGDEGGLEKVESLIRTHFDLGGTQINLNIVDKNRIIEAHKDPKKFPDLVVRVTGFSAYFASLSPEFRQMVVDRILSEE